ncbi:MAG: phosphoenolpyruvate carboxykinase (ATP) [Zetaproteobacteria bacterium]|nr:MAG: phosphoenolpyruvate carboxykinase (ATP) [Zetaproteobacteria bacterium]
MPLGYSRHMEAGMRSSERIRHALARQGLRNLEDIFWDLPSPRLYEHAIRNREGHIAHLGALVVRTGHFTGRAVHDKFIVDDPASHDKVWWGRFNRPFPEPRFDALFARVCRYLEGRQVYVEDCLVGADSQFERPVRVITQDAWHALFARTMFVRPVDLGRDLDIGAPAFTVLHVPHFHAMPSQDGTHSEAFVILHLTKRLALIGGTAYAGEIKKSIFTIMNYLLPEEDVLPMHASANVGPNGDVAIFFGLSGTGKTSLSSDPERRLLGDDELGWSQHDVFNFEGGCYAKVAGLTAEKEPLIYAATERFGTILENVAFDTLSRRVDFQDTSLTENTRAAYPIQAIANAIYPGVAAQPSHVVMLSADAFGVLPPIARLTPAQAMDFFMLGYSTKIAGTEAGLDAPEATFSPCFGAPFMARHPCVYAELLGAKLRRRGAACWLINTGWSGGPIGVGSRMDIDVSRAVLRAALSGALDDVAYEQDEVFGLQIPCACPGVDPRLLRPSRTWRDQAAYQRQARQLRDAFDRQLAALRREASGLGGGSCGG